MKRTKKMVALMLVLCMMATYPAFAQDMNTSSQERPEMINPRSDIQYYEEYEINGPGDEITLGIRNLGSQTATYAGQTFTITETVSYGNSFSGNITFTAQFKGFVQVSLGIDLSGPTRYTSISTTTSTLAKGETINPYVISRTIKYPVLIRTFQVNMISGVVTEMPSKQAFVYEGILPEIKFS